MLLDEPIPNKTSSAFNLLIYVNHGSQQFTKTQIHSLLESNNFTNIQFYKLKNYYTIIKCIKK